MQQYRSVDYGGGSVAELLQKMEADLGAPAARASSATAAAPELPVLKAKLDSARADLAQCERDLEVALDEQLTTVANKALDRGDFAGAILIARLGPRSAGQA